MTITFSNLTVGYFTETPILKQVSFEFTKGKITALLGANGCGKSTLLKTLANIIDPLQGTVTIEGKEVNKISTKQLAKIISYLPQQNETLEGITVYDFVAFGRTPYLGFFGRLSQEDKEKIDFALELTKTSHLKDRLISELSGGQRQSVCIAMSLAQDTDYILLDEPTTYLDLSHQLELMEMIAELKKIGKTVIMVLHDLNQAFRYCDQVVIFGQQQLLVAGSPSDIIDAQLLGEIFDLKGIVNPCPVSNKPCFYAY